MSSSISSLHFIAIYPYFFYIAIYFSIKFFYFLAFSYSQTILGYVLKKSSYKISPKAQISMEKSSM